MRIVLLATARNLACCTPAQVWCEVRRAQVLAHLLQVAVGRWQAPPPALGRQRRVELLHSAGDPCRGCCSCCLRSGQAPLCPASSRSPSRPSSPQGPLPGVPRAPGFVLARAAATPAPVHRGTAHVCRSRTGPCARPCAACELSLAVLLDLPHLAADVPHEPVVERCGGQGQLGGQRERAVSSDYSPLPRPAPCLQHGRKGT